MTQQGGPWFQRSGAAGPAMKLVCFPHAGGTPGFYRDWHTVLPDGTEVLAACYPGRQQRWNEPPTDSLTDLARAAADALTPHLGTPLAFFGHSMGAALAHATALCLEERHGRPPVRLFVSGHPAPHRTEPGTLHLLDDDRLLAEVRGLGLSAAADLTDPALLALTLPTLRADLRATETYRPDARRVRAPIVAYTGDQDADCPPAAMRNWAELTAGAFEFRSFPGGHFYLESPAALLRHVAGHLRDDLRLARVVAAAARPAATRTTP